MPAIDISVHAEYNMSMSAKPFWTTADLAEAAGVTADYVRQDINGGRLKAAKLGRDWVIREEDAQTWLAKKRSKRRRKKQGQQQ